MTRRDRVVLAALGTGAVLTVIVWRFLGGWPALVLILLAIGVACVAYRIEPSRIDVEHPEQWAPTDANASERLDTR